MEGTAGRTLHNIFLVVMRILSSVSTLFEEHSITSDGASILELVVDLVLVRNWATSKIYYFLTRHVQIRFRSEMAHLMSNAFKKEVPEAVSTFSEFQFREMSTIHFCSKCNFNSIRNTQQSLVNMYFALTDIS